MKTGDGLGDIQLHTTIDCPIYRHLSQVLRKSGGPNPMVIDLPYSKYGGDVSRDQYMAGFLLAVLETEPSAKILVILGSLHTLKKLEWEKKHVTNKHLSISEYIEVKRPAIKMWSVGQVIGQKPEQCDFTKKFGALPDAVAFNLDDRYRGWKLGLTATIAIVPAECFELMMG